MDIIFDLPFFSPFCSVSKAATNSEQHKIVIVGGGSGGIAVAAQLKKRLNKNESDIAIIEPKSDHYYQPLWTMVGAGIFKKEESRRDEATVIPKGTTWLKTAVKEFQPDRNQIVTEEGNKIEYEYLVVATGMELDMDKIKGLKESIGKNGVSTNYSYNYVDKTWDFLKSLKQGNAIFTFPDTAVKCGGAPQKIMWLAEDYLRKQGVRDKVNIFYTIPGTAMFAVKKYSDTLDQLVKDRNVQVKFKQTLVEIKGDQKEAIFQDSEGNRTTMKYDFIHVTPPMRAPAAVRNSPLAASNGYVDVNKYTLQHNKYPNVFSLGDSANLPTSKTIAAITQQAPTVVANLTATMRKEPLKAKYNGYTSCPIVTSYSKLILAEFKYDNETCETFPFNQAKPRRSMYWLKKYIFPRAYWSLFLKGRWYGPSLFFPPKYE